MSIDLSAMSQEELDSLSQEISTEAARRFAEVKAVQSIDQALRDYADSMGLNRTPGAPWAQPASVLEAYPSGATVEHDGKTWRSHSTVNISEPGESGGWEEQP